MISLQIETDDGLALEAAEHEAQGKSRGTVLLLHGLTTDMDEGSGKMYMRYADSLAEKGFNAFRFSFRGHGESQGEEQGATIAGEMLDLKAALDHVKEKFEGPYIISAASFGAVSTCLSLPYIEKDIKALVLWFPTLDLEKTIIDPQTEWGKRNFTGEKLRELDVKGFIEYENGFKIGRVLYEEMKRYDPGKLFVNSEVPALIVHSEEDEYVPYKFSKEACEKRKNCELVSIPNSGHGFDSHEKCMETTEKEAEGIEITVNWIQEI